jgi:hypothetical protein
VSLPCSFSNSDETFEAITKAWLRVVGVADQWFALMETLLPEAIECIGGFAHFSAALTLGFSFLIGLAEPKLVPGHACTSLWHRGRAALNLPHI